MEYKNITRGHFMEKFSIWKSFNERFDKNCNSLRELDLSDLKKSTFLIKAQNEIGDGFQENFIIINSNLLRIIYKNNNSFLTLIGGHNEHSEEPIIRNDTNNLCTNIYCSFGINGDKNKNIFLTYCNIHSFIAVMYNLRQKAMILDKKDIAYLQSISKYIFENKIQEFSSFINSI